MKPIVISTSFLLAACVSPAATPQTPAPLHAWFDNPGNSFHESSVLGNGCLGTMDLGGVQGTHITAN